MRSPTWMWGGRVEAQMAAAALVGIAALRCRALAVATAAGGIVALVAWAVGAALVQRPLVGADMDAAHHGFADSRTLLTVLVAGVLPVALAVLSGRRWLVGPARAVLGVVAVATVLHQLHDSGAWPTDVAGGVAIGLSVVLGLEWALAPDRRHRVCHGCPQQGGLHPIPDHGPIRLSPTVLRRLRWTAHVWGMAVSATLIYLALTEGVPQDPDGVALGPGIQVPAQLALAGLVVFGGLLAWPSPAAGAVVIGLAAAALGVLAAVEYSPGTALLLTLAFVVSAVLFWLYWQRARSAPAVVALGAVTTILLTAGWSGAVWLNNSIFGPAHPESATSLPAIDRARWVWSGALQSTAATVVTRVEKDWADSQIAVEFRPSGGGRALRSRDVRPDGEGVARLDIEGLTPGTAYEHAVLVEGHPDVGRGRGNLQTPVEGPMSFRVAMGSCARVGSNGAVFDAICAERPLFYRGLGDLFYSDIASFVPAMYYASYDRMLTRPAQAALYRDVPLAYIWDDHDYGPINADASSPDRTTARLTYQQWVPHGPLALGTGDVPIAQAFTIGRVRFVLTDGRSERTQDTMLGAAQERWLIDELVTASRDHALVVWANDVPWVATAAPGADGWGGYGDERRRITDALADAGADNLVMVAGDAHMVAIDDGTNTDYATDGAPASHCSAPLPSTVREA